jgi:nitrogen fixation/metabolism regulation signal transduction histidine kinase
VLALVVVGTTALTVGVLGLIRAASPTRFLIVYEEIEQIDTSEVDGRQVERRRTTTEAIGETTRLQIILPVLLIQNLLFLIVLGVLGLIHGQRISGPVYRISTDLRRAMSGEEGVRIQLREKDHLRELSARINALLDALESSKLS